MKARFRAPKSGPQSKPSRCWLRLTVAPAAGAAMVLGACAVPANAGVLDPWDYGHSNPKCWPKGITHYSVGAWYCWGVAGDVFTPPIHVPTDVILRDCETGARKYQDVNVRFGAVKYHAPKPISTAERNCFSVAQVYDIRSSIKWTPLLDRRP